MKNLKIIIMNLSYCTSFLNPGYYTDKGGIYDAMGFLFNCDRTDSNYNDPYSFFVFYGYSKIIAKRNSNTTIKAYITDN